MDDGLCNMDDGKCMMEERTESTEVQKVYIDRLWMMGDG